MIASLAEADEALLTASQGYRCGTGIGLEVGALAKRSKAVQFRCYLRTQVSSHSFNTPQHPAGRELFSLANQFLLDLGYLLPDGA